MNHFITLARFNSAPLRYALIVLHLPLLALTLSGYTAGSVLTHGTNFAVKVLNAVSDLGHNLMSTLVVGVSSTVLDIRTVARGSAKASVNTSSRVGLPAPEIEGR